MGPPIFYVVRVISDNESIVVPDLWVITKNNDNCLWPAFNAEQKAKNRELIPGWPVRTPVVITSAHRK